MNPFPASKRTSGLIRRHLAGGYSMPRSYGVHVAAPQLLLGWASATLLPWLNAEANARTVSVGVLALVAASLTCWGWGSIGAWRSAARHADRGGHRFWSTTIQALLVVGAIRTVCSLVGDAGGLGEHWRAALGRQPGPASSLQLLADGRSLLLRGGLNDGTAAALEQALDRQPVVDTLVLQSDGGWVREGRLIARIVAARHLRTRVESACSSACTLAFMAGGSRSVAPGGRLGFHAFSSIAAVEGTADRADARLTYRRAGLPDSFIDRIVATPPSRIWFPTPRELLAAGVVTRAPAAAGPVAPKVRGASPVDPAELG